MAYLPDLVLQDSSGRQVAWIEVKRTPPSNRFAAAEYYKRVQADLEHAGVRFFMFVTPQTVHLWDREGRLQPDSLASYEGVREKEVSESTPTYLVKRSDTEQKARALEYAVFNWLLDFALQEDKHKDPAEELLRKSGFLAALKTADLRFGATG